MNRVSSKNKKFLVQSTLAPMGERNRYHIEKIRGQRVAIDERMKCLYLLLVEPWWTPGKKFGWNPPPGIGVNKHILEYSRRQELKMRVFVDTVGPDRVYEADPTQWMKFSVKRGAIDRRGSVILYVFPWSRFKTHREENGELLEIYRLLRGDDDD